MAFNGPGYIIDGAGEMVEILDPSNDPLWEMYADSQVSSSWMACAYRFYQDKPEKTADSDVMVEEPVVHGVSGTSSGGHDTLGASLGASSFPLSIPPSESKASTMRISTASTSSCDQLRVKSRSTRRQKNVSAVSR